jgi:hypothetical protein
MNFPVDMSYSPMSVDSIELPYGFSMESLSFGEAMSPMEDSYAPNAPRNGRSRLVYQPEEPSVSRKRNLCSDEQRETSVRRMF